MHHQLELAYLGIEVPDPSSLTSVLRRGHRPHPGRRRTGRDARRGATTTRRSASSSSRARPTTPPTSASTPATTPRSTPLARRLDAAGFPCARAATTSAPLGGSVAWRARWRPWGVGVELVAGLEDAAGRLRVAVGARWVPHRRRRVRPRRVRHDRLRRVPRLRHRRARDGAVGLAGDGDRRGHRARGALLPLQPAPPHPGAGQGAVRPAAEAAPPHGRDEQPRRRRRGLRPGLDVRARHPERARTPRQRRHVQLLRRQPGRLPWWRSATAPARSPTTGTTTAATTGSAPGATSRCASHDRHRRRRGRRRLRPGRPDPGDPARPAGPSVTILERQPQPVSACPGRSTSTTRWPASSSRPASAPSWPQITEPADVYEWRNGEGRRCCAWDASGRAASGWPLSLMFHQPTLEAVLERRAAHLGVDIRRGGEVTDLSQHRARRRSSRRATVTS